MIILNFLFETGTSNLNLRDLDWFPHLSTNFGTAMPNLGEAVLGRFQVGLCLGQDTYKLVSLELTQLNLDNFGPL